MHLIAAGNYSLTTPFTFANIQTISSTVGGINLTVSGSTTSGILGPNGPTMIDLGPGTNALLVDNVIVDTTSKTLLNIQTLKGLDATAIFSVKQTQLATTGGAIQNIVGTGTGNVLIADNNSFDLSGVTLTLIQTLQSSLANTAFKIVGTQLAGAGGPLANIKASTGNNLVRTASTSLDVHGVTLTNIQTLQGDTAGTTFTVKNTQLGAPITQITGVGLGNTLTTADTALKTAGVVLHNIQALAGTVTGTTFTVSATNLIDSGGAIDTITGVGTNTLTTTDTNFDVHSLTLTNVQTLTGATAGTNFKVGATELANNGGAVTKIVGTGTGNALLSDGATATFSVAGVTLSNVQTLEGTGINTGLTVDLAQLATGTGSLKTIKIDNGTTGELFVTGKNADVHGLTLTNVVTLGSTTAGTTFTVDGTQLVAGGGTLKSIDVTGTGNVLQSAAATFDLTGLMTPTGLSTIKSTVGTGVTIKDNASAHTIVGGSGKDVLIGNGGADIFTGGGGADTFRDVSANLAGTTITDLSNDDTINLTDMAVTGARVAYDSGVLTIKNASTTVAITLTGTLSNNFKLVSDGASGVNVQYAGVGTPTSGTALHLTGDATKAPLVGTYGNDVFTGGTGATDTVLENGTKLANSTVARMADGSITIVGGNGTDSVVGAVERIRFDDAVLILNPTSGASSIAGIYHVAYNRAPDEAGLNAQLTAVSKGLTLLQVATNFLNSKEAVSLTLPSLTDSQYITLLYQDSFGRAPDAGGFAVQLDALAHGITRSQLLLNFATSAEELTVVGGPINNAVYCMYADPSLP